MRWRSFFSSDCRSRIQRGLLHRLAQLLQSASKQASDRLWRTTEMLSNLGNFPSVDMFQSDRGEFILKQVPVDMTAAQTGDNDSQHF